MSDRRLKQRLALFARLPTMAEEMEDVEVQDPAESPTKTALTLWMAGSSEDVKHWREQGEIPLTEHAAAWKGSYVGFRDTAAQAAERYKQRCSTEGKQFDKTDMRLMRIKLDLKAFAEMSQEKVYEQGRGKVTRLHYQTDSRSECDRGVWYYAGKPFNLNARDVKFDVFIAR